MTREFLQHVAMLYTFRVLSLGFYGQQSNLLVLWERSWVVIPAIPDPRFTIMRALLVLNLQLYISAKN